MGERSRLGDAFALALALGGVGGVALAGLVIGSRMVPLLTQDMSAILEGHPYDGLLSSAGSFLWFASATVLALTFALLRPVLPRGQAAFVASAAGFSWLLWLDDFYMMHDFVLYWYLGIRETLTLTLGAAIALTHIVIFRGEYRAHKPKLFGCSLILLGASVGVDFFEAASMRRNGDWHYLIEESPKWMGIVAWCWWHVSYCARLLGERLDLAEKRAAP